MASEVTTSPMTPPALPGSVSSGRVSAVRGTVVDLIFDERLPPISAAVRCALSPSRTLTTFVQSQVDHATVRTVALESTRGLRRGSAAQWTGDLLTIPVGDEPRLVRQCRPDDGMDD
jgi:F-type H+/Na+-transporting ATPase subunit beta